MKKTLLLAFSIGLFTIAKAGSCYYYIEKSISDTVYMGDSAWVGIRQYHTVPDTLKVYIKISAMDSVLIIKLSHADVFLHFNGSQDPFFKLFYKVPTILPGRYYFSDCQEGGDTAVSVHFLRRIDGINELSLSRSVKQIRYYNILGQPINAPDGLYIKETVYESGFVERKQYYKPQNY